MNQEPADKFMGRYRYCFACVVVGPVPVFKTDSTIISGFDPII